jgi:glycine betaine/proline transport system ATP-binding protein
MDPDATLAAEGQVEATTPILEVMARIHATPAPLDVLEGGRVIGQVSPGSILERLGELPTD